MKNSVLYVSLVAAAKYIGAGVAVSGVIGAGVGIGIIFAGYMLAYARNPYLQNALLRYLFLGFALTEAMGLLACAVSLFNNVVNNWLVGSQNIKNYIFTIMRRSYLGLANKSRTIAWLIKPVTQGSKVVYDEAHELDTVLWRLAPLNLDSLEYFANNVLNVNIKSKLHIINMNTLQASKYNNRVLNGNSGSSGNRNVLRWRNFRISIIIIKRYYCMKEGRNLDHLEENRPQGILELNEFIIKALGDILQNKPFKASESNPVMRLVSNKDILKAAYFKVKNSHGVTFGSIPDVNEKYFNDLSKLLWTGSYKCSPSKRIMVKKPNGGERPIGIPAFTDKIVQESVKMVIEPIFEQLFYDRSYGFRPNRDCLKALQRVKNEYQAVKWFIELDISKCFDSLNHQHVLDLICKKYFCDPLLYQTILKILKAGFIYMNEWNETLKGVPQGSILGPLLCNIYLHEIDSFLEDYKIKFDKGNSRKRKISKEYRKYLLNKDLTKPISVYNPIDENFKRIWYVRYADDYLIGVIGSLKDCYKIREDIDVCMKANFLDLNLSKSRIVNASKKGASYIGYTLKVFNTKKKPVRTVIREDGSSYVTRITPRLGLLIPFKKLNEKLVNRKIAKWYSNGKNIKGTANNIMQHLDLREIVVYFKSLWAGIKQYYKLATNLNKLSWYLYVIWSSCALTIAKKMKLLTIGAVVKKYGLSLKVSDDITFSYRKQLTKQSIKQLKEQSQYSIYIGINTWIQRYTQRTLRSVKLLSSVCSLCGSSKQVAIHHVNKLSNMKKEKLTTFQQLHSILNRRQIPVCSNCHVKIHNGTYQGPKL